MCSFFIGASTIQTETELLDLLSTVPILSVRISLSSYFHFYHETVPPLAFPDPDSGLGNIYYFLHFLPGVVGVVGCCCNFIFIFQIIFPFWAAETGSPYWPGWRLPTSGRDRCRWRLPSSARQAGQLVTLYTKAQGGGLPLWEAQGSPGMNRDHFLSAIQKIKEQLSPTVQLY